jgi:DNA-binding NarL/FixJ family response regulator
LALIEVQLGSMKGIDLAAHFQALPPRIAVVMLSAHHENAYATQIMQVGARGYVLKDAALGRQHPSTPLISYGQWCLLRPEIDKVRFADADIGPQS